MKTTVNKRSQKSGRLKIGDSWNAITIIALSQNNPLKAIAEFVENSLDARASKILILRGRRKGMTYLKISDNGEGIPKDSSGQPNFKYVATHICDSIKRQLKKEGIQGIQGEFGIGLLSFWTVGKELTLRSSGQDGHVYQMKMMRGKPGYQISRTRSIAPLQGTEMIITDLLPGLRQLSGEKIQRYLASELRDRIRRSGAQIRVCDRVTRSEYAVEPRKFIGQLIHHTTLPCPPWGEIYTEIYLNAPSQENHVALYRSGTRVLPDLSSLSIFEKTPWTSNYFQGLIDVPFLNLTPGTRDGLILDECFSQFAQTMAPLEEQLKTIIEEQQKQQDDESHRTILKRVQKALREAILRLPTEEYDWFEVYARGRGTAADRPPSPGSDIVNDLKQAGMIKSLTTEEDAPETQKRFFEYAGPLHRVHISPSTCTIAVGQERTFRAICRDRRGRLVDEGLHFQWRLLEGAGQIENDTGEIVTFKAPESPEVCRLCVCVTQRGENEHTAEAIVTVTDEILPEVKSKGALKKGLPGYTVKNSPGEIWRSFFDMERNIVVINGAHRDFLYAAKQKNLKTRYICRLYIKELVLANFPELKKEDLLERMIEVSLYAEETLH